MWSGIDKRRFPRANYRCSIFIKRSGATKKISTITENIGGGGVCIILDEDLGLFRGVEIEVALDDKETPIKSSGTVVWVVKKKSHMKTDNYCYDTGIEFVNISENDREKILKTVDDILKKEQPST